MPTKNEMNMEKTKTAAADVIAPKLDAVIQPRTECWFHGKLKKWKISSSAKMEHLFFYYS